MDDFRLGPDGPDDEFRRHFECADGEQFEVISPIYTEEDGFDYRWRKGNEDWIVRPNLKLADILDIELEALRTCPEARLIEATGIVVGGRDD